MADPSQTLASQCASGKVYSSSASKSPEPPAPLPPPLPPPSLRIGILTPCVAKHLLREVLSFTPGNFLALHTVKTSEKADASTGAKPVFNPPSARPTLMKENLRLYCIRCQCHVVQAKVVTRMLRRVRTGSFLRSSQIDPAARTIVLHGHRCPRAVRR